MKWAEPCNHRGAEAGAEHLLSAPCSQAAGSATSTAHCEVSFSYNWELALCALDKDFALKNPKATKQAKEYCGIAVVTNI